MSQLFDAVAEAYEAMVDWPKRLAGETPFFQWMFDRIGANRILDAACGTGHHAALFASWGLSVQGADVSQPMIDRCRQRHGQSQRLQWEVRGYDQPPGEIFDIVICIGNSLALAGERPAVQAAMNAMISAVASGGALILHVPNLWRLPDGPPVWQKCQYATLDGQQSLIIKGIHRGGDWGYVEMLITGLGETPKLRSHCSRFIGLEAEALASFARDAGANWVEIYGDYARNPYDRGNSADLIVVAGR